MLIFFYFYFFFQFLDRKPSAPPLSEVSWLVRKLSASVSCPDVAVDFPAKPDGFFLDEIFDDELKFNGVGKIFYAFL